MAVVLVDVIFFVLLVLEMLWLTISTSALDRCYSFHTKKTNWKRSNEYCEERNGSLVSMETEEEYQFINKTIQSLDIRNNEWYIGLKRENHEWKWISEHSYKLNGKWEKNEPSTSASHEYCVKIIKKYFGYGRFDDVKCSTLLMFICEYVNVTSGLEKKIENENGTFVCNHTYYNINDDENKIHTSSIGPTPNIDKSSNTAKPLINTSENGLQPKTSITTYALTTSATTKTSRKEQPFNIMLVVIVLAVLLALCICTFVAVFCWLRKKSGKELKERKSSRNPSKRNSASRSVAKDQGDLSNPNAGGVQIVDEDTVHYLAPVDDIDYPKTTTNSRARDTDLSTYAEVYDAIKPSAKLTSKYYDDEDLYLNPVNSPPTSDAQFYAIDSKSLQDVESRDKKEHPELKAVTGPASCSSMDATSEPSSSLYYATTDLSKPNKDMFEASKQGEEQRCKDVTTEPVSCSSLYATTDLGSKAYEDYLDRTQRLNEASTAPSFYNNLYESTEIIHLQNKAANKGLEQDGKVCIKEEKPRDCQTEASNGEKRKSRHPSIGSIMSASRKSKDTPSIPTPSRHLSIGSKMSASRKSKDTPSIPTPYKEATGDTIMYAVLDLLNNDKEVRPVYAQVNKKHKK